MSTTNIPSFKPKRTSRNSFWTSLGIEDKSQAVHQGFNTTVYRNIIDKLNISQNEFHSITLIPVSTIKRRLKNQERFNVQESDAMYRLALLTKLATDLFNDEDRALEWMRERVYGLGDKRPLDMVATSVDFETVKDLIGRLEHGVFS
ncbi:putative toxin-antitoxin system antitoxin component, TIGR02293 family [Vibrio xiamenensis]|uniref:Putative toxin-antitoxin system antitoxin component, TIGR02293 family n=1 Tax=Vibrio xiamenensis TaxID=861298 RepID=A0A1G8CD48_9VIBR|nr:antitoxin Xre/MbcA/ParS toxin-binding domain-containing protein [Vibrio xiamenensis]SDH43426.1 putative toxin-antitoxin system antitoxin component, TIGR02293 family [Vibrio xiamenensis]